MGSDLSSSARKVQGALNALGMSQEVVELPDSTRTAPEAAQAVGCQVGQIVKSLVFKAKRSERAILVIASGANRVDERKIEALIGEPLGKADADFVRQQTGLSSAVCLRWALPTAGDVCRRGPASIRICLGSSRNATRRL